MTDMTRHAVRALVAGCLLLLAPLPGDAFPEPFALYEDWATAAAIRSDRWNASDDPGQEIAREVSGDRLVMRYRRAGATDSDTGSNFFSNRLLFLKPTTVNQIEVELRVTDVAVTGCASNATASITRAATIDLNRISDNPFGIAGNITGDYIARVEVRRLSDSTDPDGVLTVRGLVFRCDNASCAATTLVGPPVTLGQVRKQKTFRVRLTWNAGGNEFLVGLDKNADVSLPYPLTANLDAHSPLAAVRVQHLPANCTVASGGPAVGDAEIEVRQVGTNASAVIP